MARLLYTISEEGTSDEHCYELEVDTVAIGRGEDNQIVLFQSGVSRHHAEIVKTPGGHLLLDRGSTNGTFVGHEKITEHRLRDGDVFRVGTVTLRYLGELDEAGSIGEKPLYRSIECPSCSARIEGPCNFCPACRARITDRSDGSGPGRLRPSSRTFGLAAALIFVLLLGTAAWFAGSFLIDVARGIVSSESTVASVAPEMAAFGDAVKLRGASVSFTAGPEGAVTTLADGARVDVPAGALSRPIRFQGAVMDVEIHRLSADFSAARVYMVGTDMETGPLSQPVVLELPLSGSSIHTLAIFAGADWRALPSQTGPSARIELGAFSRRYVAVLNATASSPSGSPEPGTSVDVLEPNLAKRARFHVNTFLRWFEKNEFNGVISLGDASQYEKALTTKLDVSIDPNFSHTGKYYPYRARWFGGALGLQLRNSQLVVKELRKDFLVLKTIWHELTHHRISLLGGESCGAEETYTELIENRVDWLGYARGFDAYFKKHKALDGRTCAEIQRRWDNLAGRWENFNGNHLSGPFSWQDPGGATCGVNDETYTITPELIRKWDEKLGIDVDIKKVRAAYEKKMSAMSSSGSKPCTLRELKPSPPPLNQQGASPNAPANEQGSSPQQDGEDHPCPIVELRQEKCSWSPDGYKVDPCPPGYCFDTGPRGSYICVQIDNVTNGKRSYTGRIICQDGFVAERDPCSSLILECVPQ